MHPCNWYTSELPNFASLSEQNESMKLVMKPNGKMRWSDEGASYELCKALLKRDFQLTWDSKRYHLQPAVTRSVNYLLWARDLITLFSNKDCENNGIKDGLNVDIGTGASCILALLGSTMSQTNWLATDIDEDALSIASENIKRNNLEHRISLTKVSVGTYLPTKPFNQRVLFTVCNPPFFTTYIKGTTQTCKKSRTEFHGTSNEKSSCGGEVEFFKEYFLESLENDSYRLHTLWFTCMFGHKQSLFEVSDFLEEYRSHLTGIQSTTLIQGTKHRWAVAWSFCVPFSVPFSRQLTILDFPSRTFEFALSFDDVWERLVYFLWEFERMKKCRVHISCNLSMVPSPSTPRICFSRQLIVSKVDSTWFACHIRLSISEQKYVQVSLTVTVLTIARDAFNEFASKMHSGIERKSRKWRRKLETIKI